MEFGSEVPCSVEGGSKVNKRNISSDLNEQIRQQIEIWRNREAYIEEAGTGADVEGLPQSGNRLQANNR